MDYWDDLGRTTGVPTRPDGSDALPEDESQSREPAPQSIITGTETDSRPETVAANDPIVLCSRGRTLSRDDAPTNTARSPPAVVDVSCRAYPYSVRVDVRTAVSQRGARRSGSSRRDSHAAARQTPVDSVVAAVRLRRPRRVRALRRVSDGADGSRRSRLRAAASDFTARPTRRSRGTRSARLRS